MSGDAAVILGIVLLLWLGGIIGWWLSARFYESRYKELLDASIEVNKVTINSLSQTMEEIRARKEKENDQG
jgi:uncharacterized protein YneF (UPF0154 family)